MLEFLSSLKEFGLAAVICGILLWINNRSSERQQKSSDRAIERQQEQYEAQNRCFTAERLQFLAQWDAVTKSINNHSERAASFHDGVCEAHRYQREEHMKMMDALTKINSSLDQTEKALGRINGYTNEKHLS